MLSLYTNVWFSCLYLFIYYFTGTWDTRIDLSISKMSFHAFFQIPFNTCNFDSECATLSSPKQYNIGCKVDVSFITFSSRWQGPCRQYESEDSDSAMCFPSYWLEAKHIFSKQHRGFRFGKSYNHENCFVIYSALWCRAHSSMTDKEEH